LDEFLTFRLVEQVVADRPAGQIDQTPAEDGVKGVVVLVAVFLQQRDDFVPDDLEETGGVFDGLAASRKNECPTWRLRASRPTCSQIRRFRASSQGPRGISETEV
jgi:hypothetical protein